MATPAAVLSIMVKAQGVQATSAQLGVLDKNARKAGTGLATTETHAKRSSATLAKLGMVAKVGAAAGFAGLAVGVKSAVSEFREAQKVGAQTSAVLKSTGNAAKVTKKHIEDLAGSISKKSGIDDEAIQSGANMLLTFKGVRNEVGKGNKIFDQATQLVTDMSVSLHQGLKPSAIQVGKALNDPIKGITALGRVGVTFTEGQKKQIEALVKSGDKLGAQKIIIKELTSEFKGSAAAQATAGDKFKVAMGNLAEAAGGVLVPVLDKVATALTKVINQFVAGQGIAKFIVPAFNEIKRAVLDLVTVVQVLIPIVGPTLTAAFTTLKAAFNGLPAPVKGATVALAALGVVLAVSSPLIAGVAALAAAAILIKRNWSTIGPMIDNLRTRFSMWALKNKADIDVVIKAFKDIAGVVRAVFQVALPVALAIAKRQMEGLKTAISGALQIIRGAINVFLGLLHGDWSRVWGGLKTIAAGGLKAALGLVKLQTAAFREVGVRVVNAVVDGLQGLGHMILQRFKEAAEFVKDKIQGLFSGVGGLIGKGVGKIPGIGDGIGKGGGPAGKGSAALMGANSSLAPFARVGAGFGLHVSSGLRPGAITSSGNQSYHSTGEAIDVAGDPRGMIGFFNTMKARFGGRLAELIYTPGGQGIKNGAPFTYTGRVARDHFDHVHVALDTGKPGPGDGIGRVRGARKALTGDGIGTAVDAARKAGFSGTELVNMIAIAGRESGWDPTQTNFVPPDHSIGLWQINQLAHHGKYGSDSQLKNPYTNAKAARALFKLRGYQPWHGFAGVTKSMFAKARAAVTGSRGGAAAKKAAKGKSNVKQSGKAHQVSSKIKTQSEAAFNAMNDQRLAQEAHDAEVKAAGMPQPGDGGEGDSGDAAATQALQEAIDRLAEQLRLTAAKAEEFQRKYNVSQTDYGALQKALAAVVSRELGGGIGLGFQTPGFAGGGSRY